MTRTELSENIDKLPDYLKDVFLKLDKTGDEQEHIKLWQDFFWTYELDAKSLEIIFESFGGNMNNYPYVTALIAGMLRKLKLASQYIPDNNPVTFALVSIYEDHNHLEQLDPKFLKKYKDNFVLSIARMEYPAYANPVLLDLFKESLDWEFISSTLRESDKVSEKEEIITILSRYYKYTVLNVDNGKYQTATAVQFYRMIRFGLVVDDDFLQMILDSKTIFLDKDKDFFYPIKDYCINRKLPVEIDKICKTKKQKKYMSDFLDRLANYEDLDGLFVFQGN